MTVQVSLRQALRAADNAALHVLLDAAVPLAGGSHADVVLYFEQSGLLAAMLDDETWTVLRWPEQLRGYRGPPRALRSILLRVRDVDLELLIDRRHPAGEDDPAGLADVLVTAPDGEAARRMAGDLLATPVLRRAPELAL